MDRRVEIPGPTIDATAFPNTPNTPANWFWTSTPYAASSGDAWGVDFYYGFSESYATSSTGYVRCVR